MYNNYLDFSAYFLLLQWKVAYNILVDHARAWGNVKVEQNSEELEVLYIQNDTVKNIF